MHLCLRLAWLLLLPSLLLGPGWKLRICPQDVLGASGCCSALAGGCCSEGQESNEGPEIAPACDKCCIDLSTSADSSVASRDRLAEDLQRSHVAGLMVPAQAPGLMAAERPAPEPVSRRDRLPRAEPFRCRPVPLRI